MLIGKKLISEMQVMRMKRESWWRFISLPSKGEQEDSDIVFISDEVPKTDISLGWREFNQ